MMTVTIDDVLANTETWLVNVAGCVGVADVKELTEINPPAPRNVIKNADLTIDYHFELQCEFVVYDRLTGTVGIVQSINEANDARQWVERAAYLRHLMLTAAKDEKLPLTIELVLIAYPIIEADIGDALHAVTKDYDYLHGIGVNLLRAGDDPARAFCWLLPNVRAWFASDEIRRTSANRPPFAGVTLTDWRVAGTRRLALADKRSAVHLVHGANGSGKSSLAEALEWLATGRIERLTNVVPEDDGKMGLDNLQPIIGHQSRGEDQRQAAAALVGDLVASLSRPLLHSAGAFRLDQRVMDTLVQDDDAARAEFFVKTFFPDDEEAIDLLRTARMRVGEEGKGLSPWMLDFAWEQPLPSEAAAVLDLCLYIPRDHLQAVTPLIPQVAVILQDAPERFADTEAVRGWLNRLDDALRSFSARETSVARQIDAALEVLGNVSLAEWRPSGAEGIRASADDLNAWLRADTLVRMLRRQREIAATLNRVPKLVGQGELGALGDITATITDAMGELDRQRRQREMEARELRDKVATLGKKDRDAGSEAGERLRLSQTEIGQLDSVTDYVFHGRTENRELRLGRAIDRALVGDTTVAVGDVTIGTAEWAQRLAERLLTIKLALSAINDRAGDTRLLPGEAWRRVSSMHAAVMARGEAEKSVRASFFNKVFRDKHLFAAVDELIATFTPARWAYPAIGIRRTPLEHGEIEISIGFGEATNGQFRLNTAELNLFTVALFLLCAPLVNNPLRLLVLDDPLQNMDELTVTALARGMSRLMRYYPGGWQLLMLFHGQDDFERVRQELPAVSYRLPWLSPAAEGAELAIETDKRLSNRPSQELEELIAK